MVSKGVIQTCRDLHIQLTDDTDLNELRNELVTVSEIIQSNKGMKLSQKSC